MTNFNDFTNLYSLSKTLRFELKPIGKTAECFECWLKETTVSENNLFEKDKKIFEAYKVLKPIMDKIHEDFITTALESEAAKSIDFSNYFNLYQAKRDFSDEEKGLRKAIGDTYAMGASSLKGDSSKFKKKSTEMLKENALLEYIENNITDFTSDELSEDVLRVHLKAFKGFFTYLSGYNTNRENYYVWKEEKSTAIASRIVHDNLPKFCGNILRFQSKKDVYLSMYQTLNDAGKITQIKNSVTGNFEEIRHIDENVFDITHFNSCLSQSQIEGYNQVIGNYNMLINLYKQHTGKKEEQFTTLFKQIGCGKRKAVFTAIKTDKEENLTNEERKSNDILSVEKLIQTTSKAGKLVFEDTNPTKSDMVDDNVTLPKFIVWLKECSNWDGIYWSKSAVTKISSLYFANWHDLKDKLKGNKACVSYDKKREEQVKLNDAVELSGLFAVLDNETSESIFKVSLFENDAYKNVLDKNLTPSKNLIKMICSDLERNSKLFLDKADAILKMDKYKEDKYSEGAEDPYVKQIKEWYDAALDTMHIVRYFSVRASKMKGTPANSEMENMLLDLLDKGKADWSGWYDSIRNYLTKKPQDDAKDNKLKLNFDCSVLLGGWSDGVEKDKLSVLLKKENKFYLGILARKPKGIKAKQGELVYNKLFDTSADSNPIYTETGNAGRLILKKLEFKTLTGKGFLGKYKESYSSMSANNPSQAIENLKKIISETYLAKYPALKEIVDGQFADKQSFDNRIKEILADLYECKFRPIDWDKLLQHEANGELFLFEISSKDFQKGSTGKKDLQTLYWESALTEGSVHQFNANAEIFMRTPIGKITPTHPKGSKLLNKKDVDGNIIPCDIYKELYMYANGNKEYRTLSEQAKKLFDAKKVIVKEAKQDITKDKRFYNETKYFFHCPIKLNYQSPKNPSDFNAKVNDSFCQSQTNLQFIGIDRGEKHLVYACTIDAQGNIMKCGHFDEINGTNYVQKMEERADERTNARKSWQTINQIKDLKEGYISHVVHKIVDEAIKDNGEINPHAYIVQEDLNTEMKRGRQKYEKQTYQKLETALAKKLNFVVDKDASMGMPASVSNALQLTPPIANYQDIEGKKQFGIMLYTRANYTSVTDPATGWRKTIYIKNGNEEEISNAIKEKFTDFGFDGKDYFFEYKEKNADKLWRLYSGKDGKSLTRFRNEKQKQEDFNVWKPVSFDVVEMLDKLFANFDKNKSFKKQIEEGVQLSKINGSKETAWQSLRYVIEMIQQIRNSGEKGSSDDNFLLSPVRNENGEHFDTRNAATNGNLGKIVDADANGAFNIARKGLIMSEHIKVCTDSKDLDLFISDEEWDLWLLNRTKWEEMLPTFASQKAMKMYRSKK